MRIDTEFVESCDQSLMPGRAGTNVRGKFWIGLTPRAPMDNFVVAGVGFSKGRGGLSGSVVELTQAQLEDVIKESREAAFEDGALPCAFIFMTAWPWSRDPETRPDATPQPVGFDVTSTWLARESDRLDRMEANQ